MVRFCILGLILCAPLGCGDSFESAPGGGGSTGTGGSGGGATSDPVGCADGKRELFKNEESSPNVAGCAGAFDVAGVTTSPSKSPSCARGAGDDGSNADGVGCSVADLCAVGWHVCASVAELDAAACADDGDSPSFFVTRLSTTTGSLTCAAGASDNLVGCGAGVGQAPDAGGSCGFLNTVLIFSRCDSELAAWDCGTSTDLEAEVVTKSAPDEGGALCCRDS